MASKPNPRYANGHRRRTLRATLLSVGARCPWTDCPWPNDWLGIDLAMQLHHHDDRYPEVDEVIPVSHGGSVTERSNTRLMHRWCNNQRSDAREPRRSTPAAPVIASPGWGPNAGR